MRVFTEFELDAAGEIYRANPRFARAGLHFESFLLYPARCWELVFGADVDRVPVCGNQHRPLLPAQVRAQLRADDQAAVDMLCRREEKSLGAYSRVIGPQRISQSPRHRDGGFIQPMAPRAVARVRRVPYGISS